MLYASPEQYEGKPYGTETDIYSLGILFFEMQQIFKTSMERIQEIQKLRLNLSSLSIQHEPIIFSMISEPESRPDILQVQDFYYQEHNYSLWCRDIVWMIVLNLLSKI
jgi:serine/threonine protein kinase